MKLKKNDVLTLNIEDITNLGFGVAKHCGQVIFVAGTVPGDVALGRIIKIASSYAVARVEEFIKRSERRTDSRCTLSACHSCAYKCLRYEDELALKEDGVRQVFKKSGLTDVKVLPIVPSPAERGYRNKAQYPVAKDKSGEYIIGFYAPKSHRVTEATNCPLAPDIFSEILNTVRAFLKKHNISVYNEESGSGLLRHIYLRRGEVSEEVLVTLVINGTSLPASDELVSVLCERFPDIVGIMLNENRENTNVILGERFVTLWGKDHITDTLAGVKLKVTAPSFYQVNHDCAELLYEKARSLADLTESDTLLDLYCGAGSIGLSMAKDCREVIGIEIVESAIECAKFNARENGITNASFYSGDATEAKRMLERAEQERGEKISPDVVILDPPRAGTSAELIEYIASLSPKKVVYISCNPTTLARDVVLMNRFCYFCDSVTPFDLFPATGHVESLVCLTKQTN